MHIAPLLPLSHPNTCRPTVTCRVANIFPRSNLTRNSNEIKCHQCGFSPFLLIVLGNGIRATDDPDLGGVKSLPFLCGETRWYGGYLIQHLWSDSLTCTLFTTRKVRYKWIQLQGFFQMKYQISNWTVYFMAFLHFFFFKCIIFTTFCAVYI